MKATEMCKYAVLPNLHKGGYKIRALTKQTVFTGYRTGTYQRLDAKNALIGTTHVAYLVDTKSVSK